jgi:hypothetical protein
LIFVGIYLAVKALLSLGLAQLVQFLGVTPNAADLVVTENELSLQLFSLFIAIYGVHRFNERGNFILFLKSLWPRTSLTAEAWSKMVSDGVLRGFGAASFCVGASLFLGLSQVEWPRWDLLALWGWLPILIFQVLGSLAWILLWDRSFLFLWDCQVTRS